MQLKNLNDTALLTRTKQLTHDERQVLTSILHHLREIERRRLYSDLGYGSLFEFAVKELKYSEGQAGRRIQAIRLIKEIPAVEQKIASGGLLGPKGAAMSFAELLAAMAEISVEQLRTKKFGKKRASAAATTSPEQTSAPTSEERRAKNPRYIPQKVVHSVWQRAQGKCMLCKSTRNLHIDHIHPVAKGGGSEIDNLRLLCFSCNQRAAIKEFGLPFMSAKTKTLKQ